MGLNCSKSYQTSPKWVQSVPILSQIGQKCPKRAQKSTKARQNGPEVSQYSPQLGLKYPKTSPNGLLVSQNVPIGPNLT